MKKVIITGATGMIGHALIEYLLNRNIEVLAIIRENNNRKNNLPNHKLLKIAECNLENLSKLNINENNYDVFFHFAWDGTFGISRNDTTLQMKNVQYTKDAVELAKKTGCSTFIGAGSQAEFGRVEGIISEDTIPNPENEYGKAKLIASEESRKLANQYNIKHIWTRIFSVYGPYDRMETMIMNTIKTMIEENESPKYTKGEQLWDYIYSTDVAKAMYLLAQKGKTNETYCIAYGEQHKLYEYIEEIRDNIKPNIKLRLGEISYSPNQVMNLCVSINKLKNDTGFIPEVNFEEGINKTVKWYKERMKNEKN